MGIQRGLGPASAIVMCLWTPAVADEDALARRLFFFGGIDIARDSAFGWSGLVAAPFGHLDEDGTRVRVFVGSGRYRYATSAVIAGQNTGTVHAGEILIGRRIAFDATVLVAYLGAHVEQHALRAPDPANPVAGTRAGFKALLEIYTRPWPAFIATASASASTVNRSYALRATFARQLGSFQFGIEGAAFGDARYSEARAGLLARMPLLRAEVTLAGGILSNSDRGRGFYSTLSLYAPF
jgi:hypothetical protein